MIRGDLQNKTSQQILFNSFLLHYYPLLLLWMTECVYENRETGPPGNDPLAWQVWNIDQSTQRGAIRKFRSQDTGSPGVPSSPTPC